MTIANKGVGVHTPTIGDFAAEVNER
jgi:hypothetical protein